MKGLFYVCLVFHHFSFSYFLASWKQKNVIQPHLPSGFFFIFPRFSRSDMGAAHASWERTSAYALVAQKIVTKIMKLCMWDMVIFSAIAGLALV